MRQTNLLSKWKLEMGRRGAEAETSSASQAVPPPPGMGRAGAAVAGGGGEGGSGAGANDQGHLLVKRAWEIALAPIKQIPMNFFMMYMAGSSISIFPIMMVGMMGMRPLKALLNLKASFGALESEIGSSLFLQKAVFVLGNLAAVGIAIYKCHSMGLLPTHPSDWLDFQKPPERMEWSSAGVAYL